MTSSLMNLLDGSRRRLTLCTRSSTTWLFTRKERRGAKARWKKEEISEGKKEMERRHRKRKKVDKSIRRIQRFSYARTNWPLTITLSSPSCPLSLAYPPSPPFTIFRLRADGADREYLLLSVSARYGERGLMNERNYNRRTYSYYERVREEEDPKG